MPISDNVLPRGDRDPLDELAEDFTRARAVREQPSPVAGWSRLAQDRSDTEKALDIDRGLHPDEVRFLEDVAKRVLDQGVELDPSQRARLSGILIRHGR